MMIYLKNMAGYRMGYFKGMSYDEIRSIFDKEYNKKQTLFKKDTEVEKTKTKRIAEDTLLQECFKKLRTSKASRSKPIQEQPTEEPKELSEEELNNMLEIVPVKETKAKALQKDDGIFISQDKYMDKILKKFGFSTVKTVSTPMETSKPLTKDENVEDVDIHLYRSMIRSLMYITSLRPDIMFVVCACARFQLTPKVLHLHAVKRIIRYLKGQPKLGLWYPKDSPFDLEAYTDSDYAGASLDRKSTTGDSNKKKLIQMIKIHIDQNVADLLTKAFDVSRFQFLTASIGMLNL
ncbi:hypothetical protein Tco_1315919 [Tanacetum coccineum]